jgi:hypothetical protein
VRACDCSERSATLMYFVTDQPYNASAFSVFDGRRRTPTASWCGAPPADATPVRAQRDRTLLWYHVSGSSLMPEHARTYAPANADESLRQVRAQREA